MIEHIYPPPLDKPWVTPEELKLWVEEQGYKASDEQTILSATGSEGLPVEELRVVICYIIYEEEATGVDGYFRNLANESSLVEKRKEIQREIYDPASHGQWTEGVRVLPDDSKADEESREIQECITREALATFFSTRGWLYPPGREKQFREAVDEILKGKQKTTGNSTHGNTEHNAKNREECLGAALSVLKAFPEHCKSGVAIARLVDEKALLFWPKTGEPPLSHDVLTRLINGYLGKVK
jgi:hypothetical protein